MEEPQTLAEILLSPPVIITIITCVVLAAILIWLVTLWQRRQRDRALAQQRENQEMTLERVLDSLTQDKEQIMADYEARLREREQRIAALEREVERLRDRLSSSGILGLFGGKQRDAVSALLLENEQLHELLTRQQEQFRQMMADTTDQLLRRLDDQIQESARAIRYKQALLSAFLQQEEARRLLDQMIAEGGVAPPESPPELAEE